MSINLKMSPKELARTLAELIPSRQPIFIMGEPGIGKSRIVRDAAMETKRQIIDVRTSLLDPTDLRGLPFPDRDEGVVRWLPPVFLPRDKDSKGVLFLDELPQSSPSVQSALLQLVLDRACGEYKMPEGWTIIAAGNRMEDRAGANRLGTALLGRFLHIDMTINADDWLEWALTSRIRPEVRGFIQKNPTHLMKFKPELAQAERAWPSPRTWEFVSNVMAFKPTDRQKVVAGCIGEGCATEFDAWLRVCNEIPDIDQIFREPTTAPMPKNDQADILYALNNAIVYRISSMMPETVEKKMSEVKRAAPAVIYATRMCPEFATMLIREMTHVWPQIPSIPEFQGFAAKNKKFLKN